MNTAPNTLFFTKMHGCGNDYIYIDCFAQPFVLSWSDEEISALSERLSDRHFGIGGDGIVLIFPCDGADARMRMFNADGSEGNMCGNAIRCVGKYLHDVRHIEKETVTVQTKSGLKTLRLTVENGEVSQICVAMGKAVLTPSRIPVLADGGAVIHTEIKVGDKPYRITCVSMGNPHCVIFTQGIDALPLEQIGPLFENHALFPERVNTEFAEIVDSTTIRMRVWERGSGETWACGTGACATAVAAVLNGYCPKNTDIRLELRGGTLTIRYTEDQVYMTGPAAFVFQGSVVL